ncbi:late embryogenesis abundant protein At1g64065-like [Telopea speciosissima]|uniref:late embryogenesis abundant protein At1g64065-like n=1 Tax=Telopea speciosissima TaxID=54955 RepID=UPI001CC72952|nr:late embryogenesis abundant protein At1g64065-like [Telopea speciosissima]
MGEEEQARPLSVATPTRTGDEEDVSVDSKKKLRRKRCIQCCGCVSISILIVVIILIILIFTVFKVKDPTMSLNSVSFDHISVSNATTPSTTPPNLPATTTTTNPSINATMTADMSVKNPNIASFKFNPATTILYYYGSEIGNAKNPAGNAKAKKTMQMNLTISLFIEADSSTPTKLEHLTSDLSSGQMTMSSYTVLDGRVNVLNIFKKNIEIKMNCTMTILISTTAMSLKDMQCTNQVKL